MQLKRHHVTWTGGHYNKRHFEADIEFARALSNEKLAEYRRDEAQTIIENTHEQIITAPKIKGFLASVNDIITQNITQSALLEFKTTDEMNWVKEGLHYHKAGEACAFCGSNIELTRLDDLNTYFNNEVKILEKRIAEGIALIESVQKKVDEIQIIDKSGFYAKFHEEVANLNVNILGGKMEYQHFLEELRQALILRKQNIFVPMNELTLRAPATFDEIVKRHKTLHLNNQTYSDNLSEVKEIAREKLKYHEIFKKLERFNYNDKLKHLNVLKNDRILKKTLLEDKEEEAEVAKAELEALLLQTVDESQAAININAFLEKLGNRSFTLESIKSDTQKGQYQILGHDGKVRSIDTLSTGEKNIVAFLWFMLNLENVNLTTNKQEVIIFDDPMNSNDDTAQYLIITKLQELLRNRKESQIFILTHNIHFYLNARYNWWQKTKEKKTYHLLKNGDRTAIKHIKNQKDDFKTSYDALWLEVKWLYDNRKPNLMINPLRRIIETYHHFNKIQDVYIHNIEAKKLFDVNSHAIDDLEADLNGKTEKELMLMVKSVFEDLGAEQHFSQYWRETEELSL
ncbi:AAA family ATPase [Staphylococcus delphini]|nr:AAA family ATPase [Staphylococcus delphini]